MSDIHTTRPGESIKLILNKYGMSFQEFLKLNPQFKVSSADSKVADKADEDRKIKTNEGSRDADYIVKGDRFNVVSHHPVPAETNAAVYGRPALIGRTDDPALLQAPQLSTLRRMADRGGPGGKPDGFVDAQEAKVFLNDAAKSTKSISDNKPGLNKAERDHVITTYGTQKGTAASQATGGTVADTTKQDASGGPGKVAPAPPTDAKAEGPSTAETVADTAASLLVPGYDLYKAFNDPNATAWDYAWGVVTAIPAAKVVTSGIKGVRLLATASKLTKLANKVDKAAEAGVVVQGAGAKMAELAAKKVALKTEVIGDLKSAGKWAAGTTGAEVVAYGFDKAIGSAKAGEAGPNAPVGEDIALDKMLGAAAGSKATNPFATHYVVGFKTKVNQGGADLVILYATLIPKNDFHSLDLKKPDAFQKLLNNSVQFISVNRTPFKPMVNEHTSPNLAKWANPTSTVFTFNPKTHDWEMGYGRAPKGFPGGAAFANYRMDVPVLSQADATSLPSFNYGVFWEMPKGKTMGKLTSHLVSFAAETVDDIVGKVIFGKAHGAKARVAEKVTEEVAEKIVKFSLKSAVSNIQPIIGVANRGSIEWKDGGFDEAKLWGFGTK